MAAIASSSRPAWQTEELQEEWIEDTEEDDLRDDFLSANRSQSISFTAPLATTIVTNHSPNETTSSRSAAGTFLIREDVQAEPFLPKTPGRHKKGLVKDFFTPLPLERMFEPPSPPAEEDGPLELSPNHQDSGENDGMSESQPGLKDLGGHPFTFAMSRSGSLRPQGNGNGGFPQAQSTPNPPPSTKPVAPMTDPRLRLFQFQYDTFTREHLSAMVDSIAVNSPSGQTGSSRDQSPVFNLPRMAEDAGDRDTLARMRSAKRIKLSPRSDFYGEDAGEDAIIARPKLIGRDYVGESQSLMQKIKQARDFSTISTEASAHSPAETVIEHPSNPVDVTNVERGRADANRLGLPEAGSSNSSATGSSINSRSGSAYREQAEALMAQIRGDVKSQKRLFSGDTDTTTFTAPFESSVDTIQTRLTQRTGEDPARDGSLRHQRVVSSNSTGSTRSKPRNSPRRVSNPISKVSSSRTISNLADGVADMNLRNSRNTAIVVTITPPTTILHPSEAAALATRAPAAYPAYSIRSATNDDLNRFVSSSTTASGTTITSGTAASSFVKHAGPAQIRTIAPQDLPTLPDKVGKMVYDKVLMKWVKNPAFEASTGPGAFASLHDAEGESEDPFRDIDSLDDSRARDQPDLSRRTAVTDIDEVMSKIEEVSEVDEEEAELTSFSFDDPTAGIVPVMTGVETEASDCGDYDESTDSADEQENAVVPNEVSGDGFETEDELRPTEASLAEAESDLRYSIESLSIVAVVVSPQRRSTGPAQASTPRVRSVLKSATATPVSVMKDSSRHRTPANKHRHRRSVSFSDGKRDGPIRGLSRTMEDSLSLASSSGASENNTIRDAGHATPGFVPSARSKRIADLVENLESDSVSENNESPTKTSTSERPEELQSLTSRDPNSAAGSITSRGNDSRRVSSRSSKHAVLSPTRSYRGIPTTTGNATFLTECSFGVAHDRLVQVITDVQPFEPHWEELSHIDLSEKKIESVARLKEFLPHLDSLSLNSNQLSWLSGVPSSVRTLSVSSNSLTALSSFGHLLNLENLDISKNDIDSLRQLSCLRHLRELRADANKIGSIDGLERMDGLVKLSLQGNLIQAVDLAQCRWTRLEMLNLSRNRLDYISGLALLPSLIALNVDSNDLTRLEFTASMPKLRILRASHNRLQELDVGLTMNLRTLYADGNILGGGGEEGRARGGPSNGRAGIEGGKLKSLDRLAKLENLSLRNQSGGALALRPRDIRDVKRLYLSGNPLHTSFFSTSTTPFYNLLYLEVAGCRLSSLPPTISSLFPNLRVLNLNYNFLDEADVCALLGGINAPAGGSNSAGYSNGLGRLRKLMIVGSRVRSMKKVVGLLSRLREVELLDFRMNPCTLGWYLPLLVKDIPGALQPSKTSSSSFEPATSNSNGAESRPRDTWQELDTKFRRDLPDDAYIGRLAYRGLVMRACGGIRMLDGVEVTEKERKKAMGVLKGIGARKRDGGTGGAAGKD
ncbi:hypothetical protein BDN71DRAFT_1450228 [Pleurotus eryngii]|uniref:Septation initiation network scaffold protein cdc11 n=1 Tax=Pleurotus eryngii TaxID=5323 RepID=A0A9P6DE26_PLEER|nr:hypothetical protein BDN71DRAFT_1450228 [Pleurotus eryngii]